MHGYGGTDGLGPHGPRSAGWRAAVKVVAAVGGVVILMAGVTIMLSGGVQGALSLIDQRGQQKALTVLPSPVGATLGVEQPTGTAGTGAAAPATPTLSPVPTSPPGTSRSRHVSRSATRSATATSKPAATASKPAATGTVSPGSDLGSQVLAQLNDARAAAGAPPLVISAGLVRSAAKHTQTMAGGCGLSHQCPGEADLWTRIAAEGVSASAVAENVGEAGPAGASDSAILAMARLMTTGMLNETPPDDGHRRNILNPAYRHVGISLLRDSHGTVWMTQDFAS